MRIGVDLMGSDTSPLVLFEAVSNASQFLDPEIILVVYATQTVFDGITSSFNLSFQPTHSRCSIEFIIVQEVIEMFDDPVQAIRRKKNSSLVWGMKDLNKRQLDGFVSAGNTGALIAYATLYLRLLPGIKRPALLAVFPSKKGSVAVIDVGGNVSCKAHHLVQFAQMGAAYQRCCQNIERPTVGLLNIGVEPKKGTSELKKAYQILESTMTGPPSNCTQMRFLGNIEGRDLFQGDIDVLVTDGFAGNTLLKTAEGVSSFIFDVLHNYLEEEKFREASSIIQSIKARFHYEEYPGAVLCGIDGIVLKCHGHSSPKGMLSAIKEAATLINSRFIERITEQLSC